MEELHTYRSYSFYVFTLIKFPANIEPNMQVTTSFSCSLPRWRSAL